MSTPNYVSQEHLIEEADMATLDKLDALDAKTVDRLITVAEMVVLTATRGAVYSVDGAGQATDPSKKQAFVDAITAQALTYIQAGMVQDVLTGGAMADAVVTDTSENGASLKFDNTVADSSRARLRGNELTGEAELILDIAGLLHSHPVIRMW